MRVGMGASRRPNRSTMLFCQKTSSLSKLSIRVTKSESSMMQLLAASHTEPNKVEEEGTKLERESRQQTATWKFIGELEKFRY